MSSPFSIFRRNQRILMVVATALALISFVLLGAIPDPSNIDPVMVYLLFAIMAGGVGWLVGLRSGKANDWGLTGLVLGVVIAAIVVWFERESSAVTMKGGNLTRQEVTNRRRQKQLANHFVQLAIQESLGLEGNDPQLSALLQQYSFGGATVTDQDVVFGEILRREADEMGIVVSDQTVSDYINLMTGGQRTQDGKVKPGKMTAETFTKIRRDLEVTEKQLLDILRDEIRARTADELLAESNHLTPVNYWDYYQKLNLKKSAEIVSIPVSEFEGQVAEPSDVELEQFFQEHRNNVPGLTPEGRPEEGRPGFIQPQRVKVAYLEADTAKIEESIEVTEEEILEEHKNDLPGTVPLDEPGIESGNESLLNESPGLIIPESSETPPATTDETEESETGSQGEASEAETTESEAGEPESAEAPDSEGDGDQETAPTETNTEESTSQDESGEDPSQTAIDLDEAANLQFVAFQQEDESAPQAENSATEHPSAAEDEALVESEPSEDPPALPAPELAAPQSEPSEEPTALQQESDSAEETTVESDDAAAADAPQAEQPAGETGDSKETSTNGAEGDIPPAPETDPNELTEERKLDIRDRLLRRKTQEIVAQKMQAVVDFFNSDQFGTVSVGDKAEAGFITPQQATEKILQFAQENDLIYTETWYLSYDEIQSTDDFSLQFRQVQIGTSQRPQFRSVADILFQSSRTDVYRPYQTAFNEFVFWKIAHKPAYAPNSMSDESHRVGRIDNDELRLDAEEDDPPIMQAVKESWKRQQALPLAMERAEAIVKMVEGSDKPMTETLTDVKVTESDDGILVEVVDTGEFSWLTDGFVPGLDFQQQSPVRRSSVIGAPDAGERFLEEVFENLGYGEVGVAPNEDNTAVYVIRVKENQSEEPVDPDDMKEKFLEQGIQWNYYILAQQTLSQYRGDLGNRLFEKYDVKMAASNAQVDSE